MWVFLGVNSPFIIVTTFTPLWWFFFSFLSCHKIYKPCIRAYLSSMAIGSYEFKTVEEGMIAFWDKEQIYPKAKAKNKGKQHFYFLDGPPYTSGKIHLGTAWNKSLKDMVLRYKRMAGFDVWDRAGYDMHGLPIEHKVEAKYDIKDKDEIPKFGVERFINECHKFSLENMQVMNKDFARLGVWMNFDDPYMPITISSIEAIWWLIKKAHDQGRLYEGERAMTWCASCASAVAKHELEYKNITDHSVYLKFKLKNTENEYLIIWTTTPWTIPLNLAVVVHPDFDYVKCSVGNETWIVAKELAKKVIEDVAGRSYSVVSELKGSQLEGLEYAPPFADAFSEINAAKKDQPLIYTVLLSDEYVHLEEGTGLVHFAPGCGDSDYELCIRKGIKPFNVIDEQGHYPKAHKLFSGLSAKKDDKTFIELMEERGAVVATVKHNHSYAHCWRCHKPIVYKTTTQWFFKVEDLKEQMIKENREHINWVPESAFNAFDSWLTNLRDNSITKQRYWGTPLPVWKCNHCNAVEVLSTKKEVEEKGKITLTDLHKPWIDNVKFPCSACSGKGTMTRIPDVMDVWIDPGCASWLCLGYPQNQELFEQLFPADFILEGKDQIRGWFNVLMVCSMLGMRKISFRNVYMHGFVQDALGRKMSKSLGNVISPSEIIDEYGADTFRYYTIGGAGPALDLSYNFEDVKMKYKNIGVLWNIHKYILDLASTNDLKPQAIEKEQLGIEEEYILSKLHSTIKKTTELFDTYALNQIPWALEQLFLELSRTYIQLVREKAASGEGHEKQVVLNVLHEVFVTTLKLFAPVAPFVTDHMYQSLKEAFDLPSASIHLCHWPKVDESFIDPELESDMDIGKYSIQGILNAREKLSRGVRWPLQDVVIVTSDAHVKEAITQLEDLIKTQTNVKEIRCVSQFDKIKVTVKPNHGALGKEFKQLLPKILVKLMSESQSNLARHLLTEGYVSMTFEGEKVTLKKEHFVIERVVPEDYVEGDFKHGELYVHKAVSASLEAEGFAREITRRVQQLRKNIGLEKKDSINLCVQVDSELKAMLTPYTSEMQEKCGAVELRLDTHGDHYSDKSEDTIKGKDIVVSCVKV